jgi:hypothetical protein
MKIFLGLTLLFAAALSLQSCTDLNRHQFTLDFEQAAELIVVCDNCFYYFNNYDVTSRTTVIHREIDGNAIELFSSIEFCGLGATTSDGSIRIVTDTGSVAEIGVIFPNQEYNPTLRMQSSQTGLGEGCTSRDQQKFEKFFRIYADKKNL